MTVLRLRTVSMCMEPIHFAQRFAIDTHSRNPNIRDMSETKEDYYFIFLCAISNSTAKPTKQQQNMKIIRTPRIQICRLLFIFHFVTEEKTNEKNCKEKKKWNEIECISFCQRVVLKWRQPQKQPTITIITICKNIIKNKKNIELFVSR